MAKAKPSKTMKAEGAKKRAVLVDYNSTFTAGIESQIRAYNEAHPEDAYAVDTYRASSLDNLADVGEADRVIHTGGVGEPVKGDTKGNPSKLYVCHSHQWKAEEGGGKVERLAEYQKGTGYMDVKENDPVVGNAGKVPIDKYHVLAVTKAPKNAKVVATSRQTLEDGREVETAEAIRYEDGSVSVQGHPGGGAAAHVIHNYLGPEYKEAA